MPSNRASAPAAVTAIALANARNAALDCVRGVEVASMGLSTGLDFRNLRLAVRDAKRVPKEVPEYMARLFDTQDKARAAIAGEVGEWIRRAVSISNHRLHEPPAGKATFHHAAAELPSDVWRAIHDAALSQGDEGALWSDEVCRYAWRMKGGKEIRRPLGATIRRSCERYSYNVFRAVSDAMRGRSFVDADSWRVGIEREYDLAIADLERPATVNGGTRPPRKDRRKPGAKGASKEDRELAAKIYAAASAQRPRADLFGIAKEFGVSHKKAIRLLDAERARRRRAAQNQADN